MKSSSSGSGGSGTSAVRKGRGRGAVLSVHCRSCGRGLNDGAERKLGRHTDCPSTFDEATLDLLREWRRQEAAAASLPAYCVFTDATLVAIAEARPRSGTDLYRVQGLGKVKIDKYGDQVLAVLAGALKESGQLANDTVVATVMSNLGFFRAMEDAGITVEQTKVGDRYVLEAMHARGYSLGGEQSGHVVLLKWATTGDGVLTGLHLMSRMASTGRSLAELAPVMVRLPQVLVNVPGVDKARADTDPVLAAAVTAASAELGRSGRVLLRPSGTESLVRVMVEAETLERADEVAQQLADVVRDRLAL
jgi:hypothetical protein